MTSNILKNGVDIDTLFLALEGTKRADVGIQKNGVDISNLFEPIGDGTAIANTNILVNGVDIATLFRDINEPLQGIGADWPEASTNISDFALDPANAGVQCFLYSDGTYSFIRTDGANINGNWLLQTGAGNGAGYFAKWEDLGDGTGINIPPTNVSSGWTENTYLELNTQRSVGTVLTNLGDVNNYLRITIAETSGGVGAVAWTGTFVITVEP